MFFFLFISFTLGECIGKTDIFPFGRFAQPCYNSAKLRDPYGGRVLNNGMNSS